MRGMRAAWAALAAAWLAGIWASGARGTEVEISKALPPAGGLGTMAYQPTEKEKAYVGKVNAESINLWAKDASKGKYSLAGQAGKYAGWFGIVREVRWDEKAKQTRVLLEHKHFDGMTDLHIHVASIYGAGDFTGVMGGKTELPMLSLVAVYGKVTKNAKGEAEVKADYVRVWDWGLFTFMDYGPEQTNPKWVALRKIKGDDIYTPRPTKEYYEAVLGKRDAESKK